MFPARLKHLFLLQKARGEKCFNFISSETRNQGKNILTSLILCDNLRRLALLKIKSQTQSEIPKGGRS